MMVRGRKALGLVVIALAMMAFALWAAGCSPAGSSAVQETGEHGEGGAAEARTDAEMILLPELAPASLGGEPLRVIATTSIIGDVVGQVGGDAIQLTTLMGPGQDPHSYQPAARDMAAVSQAGVIFVNGWDLEEALVRDLEQISEDVPLVAISANIEPLAFGEDEDDHEDEAATSQPAEEEHEHGSADPHVWFDVDNVQQWVRNVEQVLSALDPANAGTYASNAAAYLVELEELEAYSQAQVAQIPPESRFLISYHESLAYFADAYGFTLLGTVIPAASTLAEPSASDLSGLIEEMEAQGVCTIFSETTVSDTLAQTVAGELGGCDQVEVVQLYTGAVGPAGSGADSYTGMFRANVDAIVSGLTP